MKINLKFISLLIILFFVSLTLVSATNADNQTMQINDNKILEAAEVDTDALSADTGSFSDLQNQIWKMKDGDTLTLDKNYQYDSSFTRTDIQVPRSSFTIDGQGHTLDGKSTSRIFIVTEAASNVIIKNVNFVNGYSTGGGAIFSKGSNTQIIDCTFTNNVASTIVGGAVYLQNGGTITGSTFTNNVAKSSGGAIRLEGNNYAVTGNTFTGNKATDSLGGAISLLGNKTTISDNIFTKNSAGRDGGAVDAEGGIKGGDGLPGYDNVITNNVFTENSASYAAGALSINGGKVTISNNKFSKNTAGEFGGGIRIAGVSGTTGTIQNNTFTDDNSKTSGGAIFINGDGTTISENKFKNTKVTEGAGGAITIHGNGNTITKNDYSNTDSKTSGGAIFFEGNNGQITYNNFTNGHAGEAAGALYVTGASATVNNNIFDSNIADTFPGALTLKSDNGKLNNNKFIANTAKSGSGGAAYIEGTGITANKNTFTNNKAGSNSVGGALRWSGNKATVTENTFEGNSATNTGYAIYGEGDNSEITKNNFIGSEEGDKSLDWRGNNNKISDNTYGNSRETQLTMTDVTIYYGGSGKLVITLTDKASKTLAKKDILLSFNGAETTLTTDGNGKAEYQLTDLNIGTYKATAKFAGDSDYDASQATATVTAKTTIESKDLTAEVGNVKYNATFLDSNGQALAKGEYVTFTVENDVYRAQVGDNGVATATIDKGIGDYSITSTNTATGETATNKLKITKASPNLQATTKDIEEGADAVFDITANAQATGNVTLTINKVNYQTPLEKGKAKITVSNLTAGKYPYTVTYAGNANFTGQSVNGNLNVKSDDVVITAQNVTKYFGGSERLTVSLTDKTGAPLKGKVVYITINKVEYNRTTDDNGIASMGMNLPSTNYTADIVFKGDADYKAVNTTCNIVIKPTVFGQDLTKIERASKPYVATFLDSEGKPLAKGTEVEFNINGIFYKRAVGDDGKGALNINLIEGTYTITATNPKTGENTANTVIIKPRIINNNDVTKYYKNDTQYYVTVLDDDGNPVKAGENVTFNINGVFYTRQSGENGTVRLNINLPPKDDAYIITVEYKDCRASNKIKVLPVLSAKDINMKYHDGTQFEAKVLDGQGKPYANQTVTFNINGVFYPKNTTDDGIARLAINLPAGEYIITSTYNGANVANRVTVRP